MSKLSKVTVFFFVVTLMYAGLFNTPCVASDASGFQYWSTANFSVDLDKKWTATFQEEFRLGDDGGNLYYHHSDIGFVYKGLADWIDVGANFRKVYTEDSTGTWRQENAPI